MTQIETEVLRIVRGHVGRAWAIRAQVIANMLGVDEREVREAVKVLIEKYGYAICSTLEKPYGYFLPATIEEGCQSTSSLKSRIRSDQERLSGLEAALQKRFGQQIGLGL